MNKKTVAEARPASTVVLIRNGQTGLETLLLKRNKALLFAGGFWVFPGGAIDPQDLVTADNDLAIASRIAAAREAQEEAGIMPHTDSMVQLSHWTTPVAEPKRFSTWFYVASCPNDAEVSIDGSEIHDSQWININTAIARHEAGELGLYPPTYLTLCQLKGFNTAELALAAIVQAQTLNTLPVFGFVDDQVVVLFEGDAGFDSGDASVVGARHRSVLEGKFWRFLYENVDSQFPPLNQLQG